MRLGETPLEDGWVLSVADQPDDAIVDVLESVRWGTEGLRFRAHGLRAALLKETGARFLSLRRDGRTLATATLVPRVFEVEGVKFPAWYRTMLAVPEDAQGHGAGLRIAQAIRHQLLDAATDPVMLYGYVETDNTRSMKIQERIGYASHATFEAVSIGPLRARRLPGVERLGEADRDAYLSLLSRHWDGHVLLDFDQSLRTGDVYVLRRGGEIVAGAQVIVKTLTIESLAGFSGRMVMAIAPLLARLSPLFALRPTKLTWAGSLFWLDDPRDLVALVEHVQGELECGSAVLYLDPRSPHAQAVRRVGYGAAGLASPPTVLHMMAGHKGLPEPVIAALRTRPLVLSPLDSL
jgi:hypothetical protein